MIGKADPDFMEEREDAVSNEGLDKSEPNEHAPYPSLRIHHARAGGSRAPAD